MRHFPRRHHRTGQAGATLALALLGALFLAAGPAPAQCTNCISHNWTTPPTSGGWWSNGIQHIGFRANSGNSIRLFCSCEFYTRARYGTTTVNIAIYDAGGPWTPNATVYARGTMVVGTSWGVYKAKLTPTSPIRPVPPNTTFHIAFEQCTKIMFPVASGGTTTPHQMFLFNQWQNSPKVLPWSYRLGCLPAGNYVVAAPASFDRGCPAQRMFSVSYPGPTNRPLLGNQQFKVGFLLAPANGKGFLVTGISKSRWGTINLPFAIPGTATCRLLVSTEFLQPADADAYGYGSVACPIPQHPVLLGQKVYHQFIFPEAKANALGITMSNGGEIKLGNI